MRPRTQGELCRIHNLVDFWLQCTRFALLPNAVFQHRLIWQTAMTRPSGTGWSSKDVHIRSRKIKSDDSWILPLCDLKDRLSSEERFFQFLTQEDIEVRGIELPFDEIGGHGRTGALSAAHCEHTENRSQKNRLEFGRSEKKKKK